MLGALAGLPAGTIRSYDYGTYQGYFAENYVATQLIAAGDRALFGWKEGTAELEFLKEMDGRVYPVEVKSGHVTQAKSLFSFAQKYLSEDLVVLSARLPGRRPKKRNGNICRNWFVPLDLAGSLRNILAK